MNDLFKVDRNAASEYVLLIAYVVLSEWGLYARNAGKLPLGDKERLIKLLMVEGALYAYFRCGILLFCRSFEP